MYLQVTQVRDQSRDNEDDELYSAENFRRLARSLSGTVISSREETLVSSHSFVSTIALFSMKCLQTFWLISVLHWAIFPTWRNQIIFQPFLHWAANSGGKDSWHHDVCHLYFSYVSQVTCGVWNYTKKSFCKIQSRIFFFFCSSNLKKLKMLHACTFTK